MTSIRRTGAALALAVACALPALASAEQASELCDGSKAEQKQQPTADRSKQNSDRNDQKNDDKSNNPKPDEHKKSDATESGKS